MKANIGKDKLTDRPVQLLLQTETGADELFLKALCECFMASEIEWFKLTIESDSNPRRVVSWEHKPNLRDTADDDVS